MFIKKIFSITFFAILFINTSLKPVSNALPEPDKIINEKNLVKRDKKPWTFFVYVAADNNLRDFAARNLKQMATVGSNSFINIVVHVDIRLLGSKKTTRRYIVEKGKVTQIDITSEKLPMNSGDPATLISAAKWAFENFPADHHAMILWNHGTGIIDPYGKRLLNTDDLFYYNPATDRYELDRTIGFLELIDAMNQDPKGVCWDDTTNDYLTNQKLEYALHEITHTILRGKKLDIIGFDACLMAMLEVANITKNFAHIQVSSQEVELGPGWEYYNVLNPFSIDTIDPISFSVNIVQAYATAYNKITNDYTQSAINLDRLAELEESLELLSVHLTNSLRDTDGQQFKNIITASKSRSACTHFDEPSYIDLDHFLKNLHTNLVNTKKRTASYSKIIESIANTRSLVKEIVIANACGPNVSEAGGISIYFPEKRIHPSYKKSPFGQQHAWSSFITNYLLL